MKILLTGHLGYVGSVLAPLLVERGHTVTGLDVGWYQACQLYEPVQAVHHSLNKDVRDIVEADLESIDAVIHLAGLSNDPLGGLDPALTDEINHQAAVRLATLAKAVGVRRFVAASSCSIYGAAGDHWIDENTAPAPVTAYARSKLDMETGVTALRDSVRDRSFEVVIARPGTVFGESPMLRFDLVLNNLVAWAQATGEIHFKSRGAAWRPLLHIQNLAEALCFLAEAPTEHVAGRAFNIGFNELNHQVWDLGPLIQAELPQATIQIHDDSSDVRSYRVDCSRLQRIWQPADGIISLQAGIKRLQGCLQQNPAAVNEFEGRKFQRVAYLQYAMAQGILDSRLFKTESRPATTSATHG